MEKVIEGVTNLTTPHLMHLSARQTDRRRHGLEGGKRASRGGEVNNTDKGLDGAKIVLWRFRN